MKYILGLSCFGAVLVLAGTGCSNKSQAITDLPVSGALAPTISSASLGRLARTASPVARVAFLDKEHACECTRKRVDQARAALDGAMHAVRTVPVDHVYIDTQEDKAKGYQSARPAQALPALYFLDEAGKVVDMLQGEIGQDQISALLRSGT